MRCVGLHAHAPRTRPRRPHNVLLLLHSACCCCCCYCCRLLCTQHLPLAVDMEAFRPPGAAGAVLQLAVRGDDNAGACGGLARRDVHGDMGLVVISISWPRCVGRCPRRSSSVRSCGVPCCSSSRGALSCMCIAAAARIGRPNDTAAAAVFATRRRPRSCQDVQLPPGLSPQRAPQRPGPSAAASAAAAGRHAALYRWQLLRCAVRAHLGYRRALRRAWWSLADAAERAAQQAARDTEVTAWKARGAAVKVCFCGRQVLLQGATAGLHCAPLRAACLRCGEQRCAKLQTLH